MSCWPPARRFRHMRTYRCVLRDKRSDSRPSSVRLCRYGPCRSRDIGGTSPRLPNIHNCRHLRRAVRKCNGYRVRTPHTPGSHRKDSSPSSRRVPWCNAHRGPPNLSHKTRRAWDTSYSDRYSREHIARPRKENRRRRTTAQAGQCPRNIHSSADLRPTDDGPARISYLG